MVGPVSCIFSVAWSAGDVKEPTHLSKRVGDVVPGVVVYLKFHCTFHAWVGWASEIWLDLVSSVGRALVCCAGGRGFEPQTGSTLRVLK